MRAVAEWMAAVESGWRAGWKQYRCMRTKQRNARAAALGEAVKSWMES